MDASGRPGHTTALEPLGADLVLFVVLGRRVVGVRVARHIQEMAASPMPDLCVLARIMDTSPAETLVSSCVVAVLLSERCGT